MRSGRIGGISAWLLGFLLVACHAYDEGDLTKERSGRPNQPDDRDAGHMVDGGMDGSVPLEAGPTECVPADAGEACNRLDDDCDDKTDEETLPACEAQVMNAETECVPFAMTARCVLVACLEGFDNCDGDPSNGCEPYCSCNECLDAGSEDGGN